MYVGSVFLFGSRWYWGLTFDIKLIPIRETIIKQQQIHIIYRQRHYRIFIAIVKVPGARHNGYRISNSNLVLIIIFSDNVCIFPSDSKAYIVKLCIHVRKSKCNAVLGIIIYLGYFANNLNIIRLIPIVRYQFWIRSITIQ